MQRLETESIGDTGEFAIAHIISRMGFHWLHLGGKVPGLDGQFEIVKRHRKQLRYTALVFGVQVKTGIGHKVRETRTHYIIKVKPKHLEYWNSYPLPVLLIWYNQGKGYWTHVNSRELDQQWKSQVAISKRSKLGSHAIGDLYRLAVKFFGFKKPLPLIEGESGILPSISAIKPGAKEFYKRWQIQGCYSPVLGPVSITLRGWKHLTAVRRSQAQIINRLELLSASKKILETLDQYHVCREEWQNVSGVKRRRVFYQQTAVIRHSHRSDAIVSVITERLGDDPVRFYSVYEHRIRDHGGMVVPWYLGSSRQSHH